MDVLNLLEYEDLSDLVLLDHSYAGIVVTGAPGRIPEWLSLLAYLDAGPAPDGASFLDTQGPEVRERTERRVAESGDGWLLPVPWREELENGTEKLYLESLLDIDEYRKLQDAENAAELEYFEARAEVDRLQLTMKLLRATQEPTKEKLRDER